MKVKRLLLILLACIALPAAAQKIYNYDEQPRKNNKGKILPALKTHEAGLTLGLGNNDRDIVRNYRSPFNFGYAKDIEYHEPGPGSLFDSSHYYWIPVRSTCHFNFHYYYTLNRFLQLGGTISYYIASNKTYTTVDRELYSQWRTHYISVIPTIRFNYIKKEWFSMYSSVGIGYGHYFRKYSGKSEYDYTSNDPFMGWDITFLGISVGKTVFLNAEWGTRRTGLFRVGAGYRF